MNVTTTLKSFLLSAILRCILVIQFLFGATILHGQEQHLSSRFITGKDGLPQGFVSGIVQDKVGFIWVGTRNGLARYDGKNFKKFYHNSADTTSIAGNIITHLFLDSKNRLWIKYEHAGLDIFYPETEKVRHISQQPGLEVLKDMDIEVDGIYESVDGAILLNSFHHGLVKLNLDNSITLQYPFNKFLPKNELILGVTQSKKRHLFLLTKNFLYELNTRQQLIKKIPFTTPTSLKRSVQNRVAMYFPSDTILYISGLNGIIKYHTTYGNDYTAIETIPSVKRVQGFDNYALMYFNSNEGTVTIPNAPLAYKFQTNAASNIVSLLDKSNMLWIGTDGYGIQLVSLTHTSFQYKKYKPPFNAFLLKTYLKVDSASIPTGLSSRLPSYNLRWTYDKNSTLWMSNKDTSHRTGLQLYAYRNGQFTQPSWHYITGGEVKEATIRGIAADSKNTLWILTGGYRIHKLNTVSGAVQSYAPSVPFNIEDGDLSFIIDKEDNFWIASNHGLFYYRPGQRSFTLYSIQNKNVFDAEVNRVINIVEDRYNPDLLWMGTLGNGLVSFNKKEKKFTTYTKNNGLPDNTIYSIMADDNGYLWCSTNQGIFRFDTRTNKARKYSSADGSPDFEFNRFHHLRLPDGRFAFGGFYDYTIFDPLSLIDDTSHPNVAIVSWKVNNQPADYREAGSFIDQSINSLNEIHLSHFQNFLTFEYAALQYNQPEVFEYRHKLSGIDKDWVYTGNINSINYTALAPGTYILSLNASNAAGVWSDKIKELKIIIHPPWWKTWWAYLIYFLIAGVLVYLVLRNRLNQLRLKHQMILKQKEADQMKHLDDVKTRFFSNITHELRTPLTLIISPIEKQLHENGNSYSPKLLKGIQQNAQHLLKLINQLLDMSKLEAGSIQLSLSRGDLALFVEQLVDVFKPIAAANQIQLSFNANGMNGEYIFDEDKLEKIINNLLSNAIKFTPAGGSILVELSTLEETRSSHSIQLKVADTGIGISEKALPNIFNRFYQADNSPTRKYECTGIGLSLVQELVKLMNGNISAESKEGKGSTFVFTIPMQVSHPDDEVTEFNAPSILSTKDKNNGLATDLESALLSSPFRAGATSPLILVTDDNTELRQFITECLQPFYKIITAANGEEGFQQAQNELPDIIISDVMMPVMDGYEFCEKIKQSTNTSHIAFIMLTAKTAFESKISGLRYGADDYLSKPFHVEELLLRIGNLLKRQQQLREFYNRQLLPGEPPPVISEVQDAFLQSIYQAIEKHLDNSELDVEMLASEVAVSRRTLNRKLTSIAGMSANEIIRNYRLKKAAELLQQGLNVTQAAYRTGFSTPSWFTQSFKELYNETPLAYAEKYKAAQN